MTHEWKVPENLQRNMSFLRKFTWTFLHAPPHPTPPHPCIHAPTGSHRQACPSSASSHERYYMPHPTPNPPHPTPPMCTKHHGLLKAVVQLVLVVYLCNKVLRGAQLQSCQGTHEKSLDSRHLILAKWRMSLRSRSVWVYYIQLIILIIMIIKYTLIEKGTV